MKPCCICMLIFQRNLKLNNFVSKHKISRQRLFKKNSESASIQIEHVASDSMLVLVNNDEIILNKLAMITLQNHFYSRYLTNKFM